GGNPPTTPGPGDPRHNVTAPVPADFNPAGHTLTLNGGDDKDTFNVTAYHSNTPATLSIDGGNPTAAPGDTLVYAGPGQNSDPNGPSGTITDPADNLTISYQGIES